MTLRIALDSTLFTGEVNYTSDPTLKVLQSQPAMHDYNISNNMELIKRGLEKTEKLSWDDSHLHLNKKTLTYEQSNVIEAIKAIEAANKAFLLKLKYDLG